MKRALLLCITYVFIIDVTGAQIPQTMSYQRVQTLLDRPVAGGSHIVNWEPDGLSAGLYLYSLEADNKRMMGKMLYLK